MAPDETTAAAEPTPARASKATTIAVKFNPSTDWRVDAHDLSAHVDGLVLHRKGEPVELSPADAERVFKLRDRTGKQYAVKA